MYKFIVFCLFYFLINVNYSYSQTYEMFRGDTINFVDENGLKQGNWKIYNKTKNLEGYRDDQVVEEGKYSDDKKVGIWVAYYPNGGAKSKITFKGGVANGYAIFYHKNGNVSEEGLWKINRWVSKYKLYYEDGQLNYDFNYNESGKREGNQLYYHPNGQIMFQGNWKEGKESGELKEYYDNGELKSVKVFNEGKYEAAQTKTFEQKNLPIETIEKNPIQAKTTRTDTIKNNNNVIVKTPKTESQKQTTTAYPSSNNQIELFTQTGNNVLKNKNGEILKEGFFEKGRLKEGKTYTYNPDGTKSKTYIYKNFEVVEIKNH